MYYVLCLMSYVLCLMSYVLCIMSYVLCLMSYVLSLKSKSNSVLCLSLKSVKSNQNLGLLSSQSLILSKVKLSLMSKS